MANPRQRTIDSASNRCAAVLGLTLPGDTVLYLLLPLYASAFGVTLAEAGVLLAANRVVRIVGYGWVARSYERYGPRRACIAAAGASAFATAGYAVLPGLWALLVARLVWGLAFAAMNIATQALATAEPRGAARRSGTARAIISTGPMLGLLAGAVAAEFVGPRPVFLGLGLLSLIAVPVAFSLPEMKGESVRGGPRFALPAPLDVWSFVQGLTLDGLFVLGLSILAAAAMPTGAVLAAGAALAARYLAEILLGPPAGHIAERVGAVWLLLLVSLGAALGLAIIGIGWLWIGCILVVGLRGLQQPLPAPVAPARARPDQRVAALARLATWRDIGAGAGPLVAGILLPVVPQLLLYGTAALLLAVASLAALRR